jgi:hypothetical protein
MYSLDNKLNENLYKHALINHESSLSKTDTSKNIKDEIVWCKEQLKQR